MLLPTEGETPERTFSLELEHEYSVQIMNSALDTNLSSLGSGVNCLIPLPPCVFWPHSSFSFSKKCSFFPPHFPVPIV